MYCTLIDIKAWLSEDELLRITDDSGTGSIDPERVETAIQAATVEINASLAERYTLPFPEDIPALVKKLTVDLAIRNLYLPTVGGVPEQWKHRAKRVEQMLAQLARGEISLGTTTVTESADAASIQLTSAARRFTRKSLEGF